MAKVKGIGVGTRVRHNYASGHGVGTVVGVNGREGAELGIDVQWDSGGEPMPYTHNADTQEIVLAKRAEPGQGAAARGFRE